MVKRYDVEEWLDKQLEAKKLMGEKLLISEGEGEYGLDFVLSNLSHRDYIQLSADALRYIVKILKLTIYVSRRECKELPYELYTVYKGTRLIALESEEEYEERGRIV